MLEEFFDPSELGRLLAAIDEVGDRVRAEMGLGPDDPYAVRNALAHHEAFLDLIDHPRMLPLVVDAIGWNIQIRTTHLDYRPPYPEDLKGRISGVGKGEDHHAGYRNVGWHPDLASDDLFLAPSLDGRLPFMEIKVFYVLYDMTESNCGNLWLVPGSHRRRASDLRERETGRIRKGRSSSGCPSARPSCGAPRCGTASAPTSRARRARSCTWATITAGFGRPITSSRIPRSSKEARPSAGSCWAPWPPKGDPMGPEPDYHPASRYWLSEDKDDVPLREWVQQYRRRLVSAPRMGAGEGAGLSRTSNVSNMLVLP